MKKILVIFILITAVAATVWHRAASAATSPTAEPNTLCPTIDKIVKDPTEGNWTAQTKEGFWKSYSMSFATSLTRFVGVQWIGADVGQLTCVYNSEQEFTMQGQTTIQKTLPVLLVFHALVFQPTGVHWKHASRGVYNCAPGKNGRSDCPFKINIKPKTGDIYQEAESLKENAPQPLQPPSY